MDNPFEGLPLEGISPQQAAAILEMRRIYSQPKPAPSGIGYDDSEARFQFDARKRQEAFDKAVRQDRIRYDTEMTRYGNRQKDWGAYPGGKTLSDILFARPEEPSPKTLRQLLQP
jgi:hypothetical protein